MSSHDDHNWNQFHTVLTKLGYTQVPTGQSGFLYYINSKGHHVLIEKRNRYAPEYVESVCSSIRISHETFHELYS